MVSCKFDQFSASFSPFPSPTYSFSFLPCLSLLRFPSSSILHFSVFIHSSPFIPLFLAISVSSSFSSFLPSLSSPSSLYCSSSPIFLLLLLLHSLLFLSLPLLLRLNPISLTEIPVSSVCLSAFAPSTAWFSS